MNDSKDQDPLLLPHEADGIRELDNKLPRWWVWLFYLTTAFAAIYLVYYHVLKAGDLQAAEYTKEMERGDKIKSVALARFEEGLGSMQPATDQAILTQGQQTFMTLCAPCHRPDAGGLVGPNLTDDYWIHGPKFSDNLKVIWNGVPEKGMVMWKGVLQPQDIHAVASYIYTLRGTKPPNPKPPENLAPAPTGPSEFE
ncbi:MAG: c-type cytochrome [Verrucomicrobiales bacterium]|nr:c-type cytochrome [Verrucomicrobiales bacterium]